jgi:hypothetical protein
MKCHKKVVPLIQPIKIRHIPETQASKVGVIQPNTKSKFSYIEHILIPKIFFVKVSKKFGFLKNASHLCCTLRESSVTISAKVQYLTYITTIEHIHYLL